MDTLRYSISNSRFKNVFLRKCLFIFRKLRFLIKGYLFLPKFVLWGNIKINTRSWQTAGMLLWMKSIGLKIYEPETTECFLDILNSKTIKCVWDVGASVGYFSILAAQKGIKVYAFELDDDFIKEIKRHKKNTGLNNIEIVEKPLGINGQVIEYENYNGVSRKTAISADEFLKNKADIPDLIKIDIDGGELTFLEGAKKLLTENSPFIIMELSPSRREKLISKMSEYNYKLVKRLDWDKKSGEAHNGLFIKNDE